MEHLNCTCQTHICNANGVPGSRLVFHLWMGNISFVPRLVFFLGFFLPRSILTASAYLANGRVGDILRSYMHLEMCVHRYTWCIPVVHWYQTGIAVLLGVRLWENCYHSITYMYYFIRYNWGMYSMMRIHKGCDQTDTLLYTICIVMIQHAWIRIVLAKISIY